MTGALIFMVGHAVFAFQNVLGSVMLDKGDLRHVFLPENLKLTKL